MNSMTNTIEERKSPEEVYIDANVLIYASLDEGKTGDNARDIIELIRKGKYKAFTISLTIDELLWKVQKALGREKAAEVAKHYLYLVNLEIVGVDQILVANSLQYYVNEKLDPKDAFHFAFMRSKGIKTIISSDSDFDKIKEIKRIDFSKMG